MYIDQIKIGGMLNVEIEKDIWINTKVQDIRDDVVWVNRLQHFSTQKILKKNEKYNTMIQVDKGFAMFDALYFADEIMDDIQVSLIKPVSGLRKVQRRNSFRAQINIEVNVKLFEAFESSKVIGEADGTSVDISEFGICVQVDKPVRANTFVICTFKLNDDEIKRWGRVVRDFTKPGVAGKHFIAINFLDADEKVLKIIRKYIFELQKKMIRSSR